jgi:hypothetical protein
VQKFTKRLIDVTGMRDIIQRRIPVMTLDSRKSGPVVWLTGCIHGDEPGGAVVIQDVFKELRRSGLDCGVLHALPLINSTGFENVSRYINTDREDLNRCFPGNEKGTMGERIAKRIFDLIAETGPDLVVDLHNDWIQSVPYVVLEPRSHFRNASQHRRTIRNAAAANLLMVQESDTDDTLSHTLTGALIARGFSAFTVEAGGACGIVERSIKSGRVAILGVLQALGMARAGASGTVRARAVDRVYDYTNRPLCTSSGIIRFSVAPGDSVKANQELGCVYSAFGSVEESLRAARPGYVLGVSDHARALPGTEVIALAEFEMTPGEQGISERPPGPTSIH